MYTFPYEDILIAVTNTFEMKLKKNEELRKIEDIKKIKMEILELKNIISI